MWSAFEFHNSRAIKSGGRIIGRMPKKPQPSPDVNRDAASVVRKVTDSDPVNGEDGLASPELRRQLREAKEREARRGKG